MLEEQDLFTEITAAPDQPLHTFAGIVRDFSVKLHLPADGTEAARLVDRIQTRRLRRIPLPDSALAMFEANLAKTRLQQPEALAQIENPIRPILIGALEGLPQHVTATVYKRGKPGQESLRIGILAR